MDEFQCVVNDRNLVGEMPMWCTRTNKLWWIDVRKPAMFSYDLSTKVRTVYSLPNDQTIGSFVFRAQGGMVLAMRDGFYGFEPDTGKLEFLYHPETDRPQSRLNDGKCDRRGRYWVGSMFDPRRDPLGSFYRFDPDHSCHFQFNDIVIPNAVAFSPDDKTLYFGDTTRQMIWRFDFDLDEGRLSNRRVFQDLTGNPGRPDGATVDAEGFIWNAEFAGKRIVRYAPDGRVDRVIPTPASNPTCCGFGGPNLDVLFVTTSCARFTDEQMAAEPLSGALLAIDVGVRGLAEPLFRG